MGAISSRLKDLRTAAPRRAAALTLAAALAPAAPVAAQDAEKLDIYFIDVEGGQATLFVGPTGESLLVDTGNAGQRDLDRILDTLDMAGVARIDHMWTTHYHFDHTGVLLALAGEIPIGRFYDHGDPSETDRIVSADFYSAYEELARGKRTIVRPGDTVPMAGLDIVTLAANGDVLDGALPGGGEANPACAGVEPKDESAYIDTDNGASAGFLLSYGEFRTVNLGDLTWKGELQLMCPANPVGAVDLYLTSHHGLAQSGSPALVHGLRPRVAVMNNGTRKGGAPEAFAVLHASPGLEDLWQLHWSYNAQLENAPAVFIANVDDAATVAEVMTAPPPAPPAGPPPGAGPGGPRPGGPGPGGFGPGGPGAAQGHAPAWLIHVEAHSDGGFVVTNTRNGFSKAYAPGN